MTQPVWAVVVARTGTTAKTRLAGLLTPVEREALALAMLDDVLTTCAAALDGTIAVVNTEGGLRAAAARGADALLDRGADMNAAVVAGVKAAVARGATTVLVVPGDLPLATPDDLAAILARAPASSSVVLARDHTRTGTNALLLRPPDAIAPAFGVDSATRHLAAATAAGLPAVALDLPRLAADVDTRADLERVAAAAPGPSTAALLASLPAVLGAPGAQGRSPARGPLGVHPQEKHPLSHRDGRGGRGRGLP